MARWTLGGGHAGLALEQQWHLRGLAGFENGARDDQRPCFSVGREHAVVANHVEVGWRDQGDQTRDEVERLRHHLLGVRGRHQRDPLEHRQHAKFPCRRR